MAPVMIAETKFRNDMVDIFEGLHPINECIPDLRAAISVKYEQVQAEVSHQFRKDEMKEMDVNQIIKQEK